MCEPVFVVNIMHRNILLEMEVKKKILGNYFKICVGREETKQC